MSLDRLIGWAGFLSDGGESGVARKSGAFALFGDVFLHHCHSDLKEKAVSPSSVVTQVVCIPSGPSTPSGNRAAVHRKQTW